MNRNRFVLPPASADKSRTLFRLLFTILFSFLALTTVIVGLSAAVSTQSADNKTIFLPVVLSYQEPYITGFAASESPVVLGESVSLSWTIQGSDYTAAIAPGVGDVTGRSSVVVTPTATTTYTLTAQGPSYSDTAVLTVEVIPPPQITGFSAADGVLGAGDGTLLSWSIAGPADTVTITPDVGDVTGQTSVVVNPAETTTYTLTVTNAAGVATAEIEVVVIQPPVISSFTAVPAVVDYGDSTTLTWSIDGTVDAVTITPDVGDVTGQNSVVVAPEETRTYTLTAVNIGGEVTAQVEVTVEKVTELLIYNWNQKVTKGHRGFPWNQPPVENGNWVDPVNFADGTFYYRVYVRSQPVAQQMRLQFCFWQREDPLDANSDPFAREECGPLRTVWGNSGNVVTWSAAVDSMWQKPDGPPVDWTLPRYRVSVAVKNSAGLPVSDFSGWDWNGENPDEWYPLDMHFMVVVVAEGETFSGWDNYLP